jgi:acyl-CoA synthetase (AMP-forming)/AMP-acid ligase II
MPPQQEGRVESFSAGEILPEEAPILKASRHLLRPNGSIVGREVASAVLPLFPTFCSAIPISLSPGYALASIDGRDPVSHKRIHDFILYEFGPALHRLGFGKGDRIALILPNGPELALAIVSTLQWASCVPLSANGAHHELESDLLLSGVDLIIGPYSGPVAATTRSATTDDRFNVLPSGGKDQDWAVYRSIEETAIKLKIPFVGLVPSPHEAGMFQLVPTRSTLPHSFALDVKIGHEPLRIAGKSLHTKRAQPNDASDEVLVLFTSGTTGNKKLVPHCLGNMLCAAATIALSWKLIPEDVNCNIMPLFHIGGITRQIMTGIISGSCVICCPSFDTSIFWALLEKKAFTWYYAGTFYSKTMSFSSVVQGDRKVHSHSCRALIFLPYHSTNHAPTHPPDGPGAGR